MYDWTQPPKYDVGLGCAGWSVWWDRVFSAEELVNEWKEKMVEEKDAAEEEEEVVSGCWALEGERDRGLLGAALSVVGNNVDAAEVLKPEEMNGVDGEEGRKCLLNRVDRISDGVAVLDGVLLSVCFDVPGVLSVVASLWPVGNIKTNLTLIKQYICICILIVLHCTTKHRIADFRI